MILPYIEEQALYDEFGEFPPGVPGSLPESVLMTRPDAFVCPSSVMDEYYNPGGGGKRWATNSYALCAGHHGPSRGISGQTKWLNSGMFVYRDPMLIADALDGTSNVILLGEVIDGHLNDNSSSNKYGYPVGHVNRWPTAGRHLDSLRTTDNPVNTIPGQGITFSNYGRPCNGAFGSRHPGGAQFAYTDGSVHFISEDVNLSLYRLLGQRASGQPKEMP
jgi:prepilin-type processing-associated H-X9-DG protein